MKVLQIHNRYIVKGGEDTVCDNEYQLLKQNGIIIERLLFTNTPPRHILGKVTAAINSIFSLKAFFCTCKKIRQFKPDIIHIHNLFYSASPSILWAAKFLKIPVVLTLHNYRLLCIKATFLRNSNICCLCNTSKFLIEGMKNRCFKGSLVSSFILTQVLFFHRIIGTWRNCVHKYICLTPYAKSLFVQSQLKIDDKKFVIKPNWCYENVNQPLSKKNHFLYIGRLSSEKGVKLLIKTFNCLSEELHIIGTGPLKDFCSSNKNHNITMFDELPNKDIYNKLSSCKALLLPSLWFEMFPMVILEAFSTGTPVIASRIGNLQFIIDHGKTGLLFKPNDKEDLANTITLLKDEQLYFKLCQNAYIEYKEKYSPKEANVNLINIYHSVLRKESGI